MNEKTMSEKNRKKVACDYKNNNNHDNNVKRYKTPPFFCQWVRTYVDDINGGDDDHNKNNNHNNNNHNNDNHNNNNNNNNQNEQL